MSDVSKVIRVSQGDMDGIGMEAFLRVFLCQSSQIQQKFRLYCHKEVLNRYCKILNLPIEHGKDDIAIVAQAKLNCKFVHSTAQEYSCKMSFDQAIADMNDWDLLITLPASKINLQSVGHTDTLRKKYRKNITMNFVNSYQRLSLLTDHIPLSEVELITEQFIVDSITTSLLGYQAIPFYPTIERVIILGFNPHAGEQGCIAQTDKKLSQAMDELRTQFPNITFTGPVAGDTIALRPADIRELIVSPFHDQGLTFFKTRYGTCGINLSLGAPFIRVSPDHGTAKNLLGKNTISLQGMHEVMNFATSYLNS